MHPPSAESAVDLSRTVPGAGPHFSFVSCFMDA